MSGLPETCRLVPVVSGPCAESVLIPGADWSRPIGIAKRPERVRHRPPVPKLDAASHSANGLRSSSGELVAGRLALAGERRLGRQARKPPPSCANWPRRSLCRQQERFVKPSAQPTLVRTQHLPPPAKTPPWLRILALAGRFFSVPACVTLSRGGPLCCGVHGHIADRRRCCRDGRYAQLRRSVCTVAAVGAHCRRFHGRPRTGRADRVSGLKVNRGAGRASCGHPAVRAPSLWGSRTRPMLLTWPFTRLARIR